MLEIVIVMRKEREGGLSGGEKINLRAVNREEKLFIAELFLCVLDEQRVQ